MIGRLLADQRVAYLLAGAVNTAFGLAVFVALHLVLPYVLALLLAYVMALPVGFTLQRRYVFGVHGSVLPDLVRYATVQGGALALNAALLPAFVEVAGAPVVPAQVVALGLTVVASFLLHRGFTFARPGVSPPAGR